MIPSVCEKDHSDNRPDVWEVVQTRNTWQSLANVQGGKDEGAWAQDEAAGVEREGHAHK